MIEENRVDGTLPTISYVIERNFPKNVHSRMMALALGHAFSLIPQVRLSPLLQQYGVKTRQFTAPIVNDPYLMRNCKAYILAYVARQRPDHKEYDLDKHTATLLHHTIRRNKDLKVAVLRLANRHSVLTLQQLDALIADTLNHKDIHDYLRNLIYNKARFLEHDSYTRNDIKADLLIECNEALLKAYPSYNDTTHLFNLVRRTAHNSLINLIVKHTAQCRSKFAQEGNRNAYRAISIEAMQEQQVSYEDSIDVGYKASASIILEHPIQLVELNHAFDMVSISLRHPLKQKFLDLVRGKESPEFSSYLGMSNVIFAIENDIEYVIDKTCEFLNVEKESALRFLKRLRPLF
jgi:DNA-directed RNA polymerase specialized sigma24 family protein